MLKVIDESFDGSSSKPRKCIWDITMRNLKERATTNAKNYECVIKMFGRHDRKFERERGERTSERTKERKKERKVHAAVQASLCFKWLINADVRVFRSDTFWTEFAVFTLLYSFIKRCPFVAFKRALRVPIIQRLVVPFRWRIRSKQICKFHFLLSVAILSHDIDISRRYSRKRYAEA